MSLFAPAITGSIMVSGAAIFPGSQNLPKIAIAVGNSIQAWLPFPVNVLALGVTIGVSGGGTVLGKMVCFPGGYIPAALLAAGYTGANAPLLGASVESGVSASFNASAQYFGLSVGVSSGTDTSKIIQANAASLIPIMLGNLAAVTITGVTAAQLAPGLSTGISTLILTGIGFGGVIPVAPAPSPGVGSSTSIVF